MDIIRFSIRNPVTVLVGVILILLFGLIALQRIPVQLSPNVQEPVITVTTIWPGATPYEIERDIIEEQEKVLKGVPGLYEMESSASNNRGYVTLRFRVGTDSDTALLHVSNKLDEVRSYPENVDKPYIRAAGEEASPVIWMNLRSLPDNPREATTYFTFFENDIRQFLDRIPGVADLRVSGGLDVQLHVNVKPELLASYGLTVDSVVNALRNENVSISAGNLDVGRWDYRVRAVAEFRSISDVENLVVVSDGQRFVRIRDVAEVQFGFERPNTPTFGGRGEAGINVGIIPEPNTNVLDLTDRVERIVDELNQGRLKEAGLYLDMVNEQRPYIRGAINLLRQNIAIGGTMALIVLLLFLRSLAPTIVVSTAIPISIIGTFIFMYAFGSSLNVVSLAGIAFAVGMLVDNAIVVLENIDRHRRMGKRPAEAAYEGTREVWGAVLASSLTTIAVFLPVVFLEDEAGQLFRDIALAVSCAVAISLVSSMTVIPMFSKKLFAFTEVNGARIAGNNGIKVLGSVGGAGKKHAVSLWNLALRFGTFVSNLVIGVLNLVLRNMFTRLATISALASAAVFAAYLLMPKMEYLPEGNRDLIINIMIPPPGLSYEEREQIGKDLFAFFDPHMDGPHNGYPQISRIFYVGRQNSMFMGVVSAEEHRTRELIPLCREAMASIPGVNGISNQASIFQSGLGEGRTIRVNLAGNQIEDLVAAAETMMGRIQDEIPEVQTRPVPSLEMMFPEVNFVPSRERLRAVGMTAREFGIGLDVLMDGRKVGEFKQEGQKKIDLLLRVAGEEIETPEQLYTALMVTRTGAAVPVSTLAVMENSTGLTQIRHLERNRTVSLRVTPPTTVTLQEAMEIIDGTIIPSMQDIGMLDGIEITMTGAADKLTETRRALQWNFVLAAGISYLLMAALLGNFLYPLVILFAVPLAGAGGFIGLRLVHTFIAPQQMDILTMLGFIILVGVVVNNPILIVYQSLNNIRFNGMQHKEAVIEAARTRLRPIYMSASTSIFGMLPLVLWPGPGSELYRGLGSVVLGGLALSTVFTVFLIPPLLMFFIKWERPVSETD